VRHRLRDARVISPILRVLPADAQANTLLKKTGVRQFTNRMEELAEPVGPSDYCGRC
jgi:hypothetical protein